MAYGLNMKTESFPVVPLPSPVSGKKEGYNRVEVQPLVGSYRIIWASMRTKIHLTMG